MNPYFAVAGALAFLVGLIHSLLGEIMIFRKTIGSPASVALERRYRGILRATWHAVPVFGWGFGAILLWFPSYSSRVDVAFVEDTMALSFLAASLLTLYFTKGRHPGWIALLVIAVLVWLG